MDPLSVIVGATAGAILGIGGNFAYDWLRATLDTRSDGKLDIAGTWGEWTPKGYSRQFSVGVIRYRFWKRRYEFDGTNYHNDGSPFCYWRTTSSSIDRSRREFHYVFETRDAASMQVTLYGYGVISLVREGKLLVPGDGFYIYSTGDDSARQMSHTMQRLDPAGFKRLTENAATELERQMPNEWAQRAANSPV